MVLLIVFQAMITVGNAQTITDSKMQKIYGFRAFYETLGKSYPADSTVSVNEATIAGVKTYWLNENLIGQKEIIVYLHGGVYTYGTFTAYKAMLTNLSKSMNKAIVYVEYSLSPEHPFPTANNEILAVYKELKNKYPKFKISIIGDSAGGGLAISLVNDAQKAGIEVPSKLVLISPWIDLKANNESYITKKELDPILNREFLYSHALMYASNNILQADPSEIKFKEFPPVFLLVGTDEVLNDDSKNFYNYIKSVQTKAKLKEFKGQKHVWIFSHIDTPASIEAVENIEEFLSAN